MAGIDIASNSALLSVADKLDTQNTFLAALAAKGGVLPVKDWATVQALVRSGLASKVFAIGDQLTCNHETYGELVWDVIGIDHDTPSDSQFKHSMTLQLHNCISKYIKVDEPEALYYCENELPAGTYYFTIHSYDAANGGNTSYSFTLTAPVPAGGQIDFRWGQNVHASEGIINTYASSSSSEVIETVGVTEGTEGTFLGITDGSYENMNHAHKIRFGSNRWGHSAVRQWINSDAEANLWWTSQNKFDRPSSNAATAGFLKGIDADFISVIGKVNKRTALNTITDGGGYEESEEKMFLISRSEVFGGLENNTDEGKPYPYYENYTALASAGEGADSNRIKYAQSTARYWWLRSPYYNTAYTTRYVSATGNIYTISADYQCGVAPACCIV